MERLEALGLIETFGLVFVLEAADAMCKAADVELIGYENVASGYISVLVKPHQDLAKIIARYNLDLLLA